MVSVYAVMDLTNLFVSVPGDTEVITIDDIVYPQHSVEEVMFLWVLNQSGESVGHHVIFPRDVFNVKVKVLDS